MSNAVEIVEVGPRDGLQNEATILTTDQKVELISALDGAGLRRIEVVSFARPDRVPQMADAEAVMAQLGDLEAAKIGLVMNARGWERAKAAGVDEINFPVMATETFNRRNQGASVAGSVDAFSAIAGEARELGVGVTAGISVAWGCPFEGEVERSAVLALAEKLLDAGCGELALSDTIGVADPWSVEHLIREVRSLAGDIPLRVHFHDTRNTGIANAYAAVQSGVSVVDASVGGIGGCPFAPNATGNIATDDLVYMLHRASISTGVDVEALLGVSALVSSMLGKEVPALLPRAGLFPPGG